MADSEAQGSVVTLFGCGHAMSWASRLSFAQMKLSSMDLQASKVAVLVYDARHRSMCSTVVSQQSSDAPRAIQCLPPCHFAHIGDMA
jgi:hypothetical protein